MRGEDHRHPARLDLVLQGAAEGVDPVGIESGEGLVEDQEVRFVDEGDSELHPLLVTQRERLDRVLRPLGDTQPLHPALRCRVRLPLGDAVQLGHVDQLIAHPHLRVQPPLLRHVADPPPLLRRDRTAAPENLTGIGGEDAEDDPHRRRLAGPVGTDEAEHLAGPDREGDVLQRGLLAIALAQPEQLQRRIAVRSSHRLSSYPGSPLNHHEQARIIRGRGTGAGPF